MFLAKCKASRGLKGFPQKKICEKHFMARIRSFLHLRLNKELNYGQASISGKIWA
jgi:predicted HicB family RNase H-like nuclease